jgi:hypothetical protein
MTTPIDNIKIKTMIEDAFLLLENADFPAYIVSLEAIGSYMQQVLGIQENKPHAAMIANQLALLPLTAPATIKQQLGAQAFEIAWKDGGFERLSAVDVQQNAVTPAAQHKLDERHLTAKYHLSEEARHQIKLGMLTLRASLRQKPAPAIAAPQVTDNQAIDAAHHAIDAYKNSKYVGKGLTAVTSLAFGVIETGVAILGLFYGATIVWSPLVIPIFLLTTVIAAAATWATWKTYVAYVPDLVNNIIGKNALFDGLTSYPNKSKGIRGKLSLGQKLLLLAFVPFAGTTGIAVGALGCTSTLAIPQLLGLGPTISAFFPYLAIGLAGLVAITITATYVENFAKLLQNENPWDKLKRPFLDVEATLGDGASLVKRIFAYTTTGLFVAVGAVALILSSYSSIKSVAECCPGLTPASPGKSAVLGFVIGGIANPISRAFFYFTNMTAAAVMLFTRLFKQSAPTTTDEVSTSETAVKVGISGIDALSGALFFAQKMQSQGENTAMIVLAGLTNGLYFLASDMVYVATPDDPDDNIKQKAKIHRRNSFQAVANNSQAFFAVAPNPVVSTVPTIQQDSSFSVASCNNSP